MDSRGTIVINHRGYVDSQQSPYCLLVASQLPETRKDGHSMHSSREDIGHIIIGMASAGLTSELSHKMKNIRIQAFPQNLAPSFENFTTVVACRRPQPIDIPLSLITVARALTNDIPGANPGFHIVHRIF